MEMRIFSGRYITTLSSAYCLLLLICLLVYLLVYLLIYLLVCLLDLLLVSGLLGFLVPSIWLLLAKCSSMCRVD